MAEDIHVVRLLCRLINFIAYVHPGCCCFMLHDVCVFVCSAIHIIYLHEQY
jgi:hypothetical protein